MEKVEKISSFSESETRLYILRIYKGFPLPHGQGEKIVWGQKFPTHYFSLSLTKKFLLKVF